MICRTPLADPVKKTGKIRIVPVFDVCRKIAESKGIALRVVYEQILRSMSVADSEKA